MHTIESKFFSRFVVILSLVFGVDQASAQNGAGSVYSIFGIGELSRSVSVASQAMGNTAIGLSNPYQINITNPAANGGVGSYFNHVFDIGMYYASTNYQTQETSENGSYGGVSDFSFWFKYGQKGSAIIGLSSYSNVGYNIYKDQVNSFQTGDYDIAYQGSGGLNEAYFSNSYALFQNFSVGLKLAFIFGSIDHTEDVVGSQSLSRYMLENHTYIANLDLEYSLNYRLPVSKNSYVNFGLIYKKPTQLSGNTSSTISAWDYSEGTTVDEAVLYEEKESTSGYKLPRKMGFGVSLNTKKVMLAGDVEFNQWKDGEIEGYSNDLVNTWRYSAGLEVTPNRFGDQTLGRISYRIGGYYENSYLKINGVNPETYAFTSGLSIPLRTGSAMNLSYQRKYNGTTSEGLILESSHVVAMSFSIRRRWFQRPKYD
ncbi:hypothetical protein N7E81_17555 [Reichenbachiella carrageenanivorans]|uniref:Long-chain fatty acid transport protein n=1 Tax=Reichenbachiella carrageenanivorans TaxID=2979869 RepID=A0ABY6CZ33_9BACT|nr:hypothetical protein [Reichenbachiella carrageenanivorans]UXX79162.1 hypothetical protein N7E81_17555 [Reichenbachiella carrageenanivorans]